MPRLARLDAPGVLHHVMARGIERRRIFLDDQDREDFVRKLSQLAEARRFLVYYVNLNSLRGKVVEGYRCDERILGSSGFVMLGEVVGSLRGRREWALSRSMRLHLE
jgi:hypothetical protein